MPDPVFVIGGEALYRAALPRADVLYLTEIERDFDGDARFPDFDRTAVARNRARDAPAGEDLTASLTISSSTSASRHERRLT